jgi:hypothetical protein
MRRIATDVSRGLNSNRDTTEYPDGGARLKSYGDAWRVGPCHTIGMGNKDAKRREVKKPKKKKEPVTASKPRG